MRHELYDTRKKKSYVQLTIQSITKREECIRLLLQLEDKFKDPEADIYDLVDKAFEKLTLLR
jgi:hypothetical protein